MKNKAPYCVAAIAMTIRAIPSLKRKFFFFFSSFSSDVLDSLVVYDKANKWLTPILRKMLRSVIEKNDAYLSEYWQNIQQLKDDKELEFSIKIVGAGTKNNIINELEGWITILKSKTIHDLRDGVEFDEPNTMLYTDMPEKYTGIE